MRRWRRENNKSKEVEEGKTIELRRWRRENNQNEEVEEGRQ